MELEGSSRIAGVGAYLPKQRITSESIMDEIACHRFGTPPSYLSETIGIRERRVADETISRSDMAIWASESALEDAGVRADEIDLILYCGIEGDWQEPATAHCVAAELGAHKAICLDVSNACLGFMNGLAIADMFVASGKADSVLVCTGEKTSELMFNVMGQIKKTDNKEDYKRWLGFLTVGDAGGAMVVQASTEDSSWKHLRFCSEGVHANLCYYRYEKESVDAKMLQGIQVNMMMKNICDSVFDIHQSMIEKTYEKLSWTPENVDKMYAHQVGAKPHSRMAKMAHLPLEDAPITYENYGNLATASIAVNMALNRPNRGDKLLILMAGSGISVCQAGMVF